MKTCARVALSVAVLKQSVEGAQFKRASFQPPHLLVAIRTKMMAAVPTEAKFNVF